MTNEALRDRRNDFLPSQCCTAALDQLQAMVGFISTIDIQVNAGCGIQINNLKSQCLQKRCRAVRTRHGDIDAVSDICEPVDKVFGGAACADAQYQLIGGVSPQCVYGRLATLSFRAF